MKNYPYSNSNCSVTNNNTQDCSLNNASMKKYASFYEPKPAYGAYQPG